jgi:glutathione synthase/RimK-type ligase-like ATP-grasp enzyme
MKKIGLGTYHKSPLLIPEDQPLLPLLLQLGVEAVPFDWELPIPSDLDAVIVRSCWNNHLKPDTFIEWIDSVDVPLFNSADVIRWNQDKTHLLDLQKNGVPLPRTEVLAPGSEALRSQYISTWGSREVVIKPTVSAAAHQTFRLKASDQVSISKALASIPDHSPLLLQEFVPAILTEGELSFIYFNGKFSHATRKIPQAGDFRVQEYFGGSRVVFDATQEQVDETTEILRAADGLDWLYARVDVVPFRGKLHLMEVEAIDPMLYFTEVPTALGAFARAIAERV